MLGAGRVALVGSGGMPAMELARRAAGGRGGSGWLGGGAEWCVCCVCSVWAECFLILKFFAEWQIGDT